MKDNYEKATHDEQSLRAKPTKAPFGYYGSKQRLARRLVRMLPPHSAWVEAFCGAAALTLAKRPSPIEVINDQDGDIVNVFRQLRENHEELCRAVALTPYSLEEFKEAQQLLCKSDPVERARRFLVLSMMTVNGTSKSATTGRAGFSYSLSYARGGREARVNRWFNLPERLALVVDRLRGVRVENRDALDLIDMFSDRPNTLMYLDPPYFTKREHSYAVDANDRDFHERLLLKCRAADCMMLISGYNEEIYNDLLSAEHGWTKQTIECSTRDTTGKDYARSEILWTNRQFEQARTAGEMPIALTEREKRLGKINPSRG